MMPASNLDAAADLRKSVSDFEKFVNAEETYHPTKRILGLLSSLAGGLALATILLTLMKLL